MCITPLTSTRATGFITDLKEYVNDHMLCRITSGQDLKSKEPTQHEYVIECANEHMLKMYVIFFQAQKPSYFLSSLILCAC